MFRMGNRMNVSKMWEKLKQEETFEKSFIGRFLRKFMFFIGFSQCRYCAYCKFDDCRRMGLEARLCPTGGHPIVVAKTPCRTRAARITGLWALRRAAAGAVGAVAIAAVEPRMAGRTLFARGGGRQQRPAPRALQGRRGVLEDRDGVAMRFDLRHRGRGGGRQQAARGISQTVPRGNGCDEMVISGTDMPSLKHPALTYALARHHCIKSRCPGRRAICTREYSAARWTIRRWPYANCSANCGKNGRVAIPGFYDDVVPLSAYERAELARHAGHGRASTGRCSACRNCSANAASPSVEQRSARPTSRSTG